MDTILSGIFALVGVIVGFILSLIQDYYKNKRQY